MLGPAKCNLNIQWNITQPEVSDSLQPMEDSLPAPSVHGILQARILEWVVISFPRGSLWPGVRDGELVFPGNGVSVQEDEKVLELLVVCGGCPAMSKYLMLLSCALNNG